jgi:hypothetical protein
MNLSGIKPTASSFAVKVNSLNMNVIAVTISGNKVLLNLFSQVYSRDIITISYTKPSVDQLQSLSGGQALSFVEQPVTNMVTAINAPPIIVVNSQSKSYGGFVSEINASGSYDIDKDKLTFSWIVPANIPVSSVSESTIYYLGPFVNSSLRVEFTLKVNDGRTIQNKVIPIEILPFKPELEVAEISDIEASSFFAPYNPHNVIDGNIGTMWAAAGNDQWIILEFKQPFYIQHVKLAFQPGQRKESYFDLLGSTDKKNWESLLIKSSSCNFSGDLQTFEFPPSKSLRQFNYMKLIGLGSSADSWNYISELRVFGYKHRNPPEYNNLPVKVFPNPARESVTIRIDDANFITDFIQFTDLSGSVVIKQDIDPDLREVVIPLNLKNGAYILQLGVGKLTKFAQKLIIAK